MSSLAQVIRDLLDGTNDGQDVSGRKEPDGTVTWEAITFVNGPGRYVVLGRELGVTGNVSYWIGSRVPVVWKDGKPLVILGHHWKRAQFKPAFRSGGVDIVEELFVKAFKKLDGSPGTTDVWWHNYKILMCMDVAIQLPDGAVPGEVKWGLDGKSFGVKCGNGTYAVFSLDREDANKATDDPGYPARLLYAGKPLDVNTHLVTASFANEYTMNNVEWISKTVCTWKWIRQYDYWWHRYYWSMFVDSILGGWESDVTSSGTASSWASRSFGLKDVLNGVTDYYGNKNCTASVLDWYVNERRELCFIVHVEWDYFWIRSTAEGSGSYMQRFGSKPGDIRAVTFKTGPGGAPIGAKKRSDQTTVPESHVFLYNASTQSVEWATASDFTIANRQTGTVGRIWDHAINVDPGHPGESEMDGSPGRGAGMQELPPSTTESYYAGANYQNIDRGRFTKDAGKLESGNTIRSSSETYQMFSLEKCPFLAGLYITETKTPGTTSWTAIIGSWDMYYRVNYQYESTSRQRLWHHRVAKAQVFSVRANKGTVDSPVFIDEPRIFLVVERYPFIGGTNYINDLPMIWVGIVTPTGQLVKELRPWSWGLGGASLLSGNGHRVLWSLVIGAIMGKAYIYHTNLDTGVELQFSADQYLKFLEAGIPSVYTPDFLWTRQPIMGFLQANALPSITDDEPLLPFGKLSTPPETSPAGSVRVMNDSSILTPLGRYQQT